MKRKRKISHLGERILEVHSNRSQYLFILLSVLSVSIVVVLLEYYQKSKINNLIKVTEERRIVNSLLTIAVITENVQWKELRNKYHTYSKNRAQQQQQYAQQEHRRQLLVRHRNELENISFENILNLKNVNVYSRKDFFSPLFIRQLQEDTDDLIGLDDDIIPFCPEVPFIGCSVCGEGKCVANSDATVIISDRTYLCGELENEGLSGKIPATECAELSQLIDKPCACGKQYVTMSPSGKPTSQQPTILGTTSSQPSILETLATSATPTLLPRFTELPSSSSSSQPSSQPSISENLAISFTPTILPRFTELPTSESSNDFPSCPEVPPDGCSICGDGKCVSQLDASVLIEGLTVTCGNLEESALDGKLESNECIFLSSLVNIPCACKSLNSGTKVSSSPTTSESLKPEDSSSQQPTILGSLATNVPVAALASSPVEPEQGCPICGEGKKVAAPDAIFTFPGQPSTLCGTLEMAGENGLIPLDQCEILYSFLEVCECAPESSPVDVTIAPLSPVPTVAPTDAQIAATNSPVILPTTTELPSNVESFIPTMNNVSQQPSFSTTSLPSDSVNPTAIIMSLSPNDNESVFPTQESDTLLSIPSVAPSSTSPSNFPFFDLTLIPLNGPSDNPSSERSLNPSSFLTSVPILTIFPSLSPSSETLSSAPSSPSLDYSTSKPTFRLTQNEVIIPEYQYSRGNCPEKGSTGLPCAPNNIDNLCSKQIGSFSQCLQACEPSICCIHDAPAETNSIAATCNNDENCPQYTPCYIVWWKLNDTIGPAPFLRLGKQRDNFYDTESIQDIVDDPTFYNQWAYHHWNNLDNLMDLILGPSPDTLEELFSDPSLWDSDMSLDRYENNDST